MALDEKRRQKKLAKKAARRKAKRADQKQRPISRGGLFPAQAAQFPIRDCLMNQGLFEIGLGQVILSRSLPNGDIAMAVFLVDVYSMGAKDAFYTIASAQEYTASLRHIEDHSSPLERLQPSCLRKLVEGAVDYARGIGFEPHPDYAPAAQLFGDIDAGACSEHYTYGKEGKPLYISSL